MIGTLAKLNVLLTLTNRDFNRGLDEAENRLERFGRRAMSIGKTMTAAFTLPIVAGFAMAVNAASDLEEALSAVGTVYGDSAEWVIKWSKRAATEVGLSQAEYLQAAATLGVYGQAAGLTGDALATFADQNILAAADLASFYNVAGGVPAVLDAIQSALMGEYDALQRMGILINEDIVNQYAWSHGIAAVGAELTEQQKVLARQGVIMDGLGAAQGDFARTSGGLANQTRILRARFLDLAATVGKVLLPVALKIADAVAALFDHLEKLSPATLKWVVVLGAVIAAAGPLLLIFGSLASAFGSIAAVAPAIAAGFSAMLGPLLLVAAAAAVFFLAWKTNFLGIRDFVEDLVGLFQAFRMVGMNPLEAALVALAEAIDNVLGTDLAGWVRAGIQGLESAAASIGEFVAETIAFYDELRRQGFVPVEAALLAFGNALDRLLGTDLSPFFGDLGAFLTGAVFLLALGAGVIKTDVVPAFLLLATISFNEVLLDLSLLYMFLAIALPPIVQGFAIGWMLAWGIIKKEIAAVTIMLGFTLPIVIADVQGAIIGLRLAWGASMQLMQEGTFRLIGAFNTVNLLIWIVIRGINELGKALGEIDWPEWLDLGNIDWNDINPFTSGVVSAENGPSGQDMTVAGVEPFENMKDGILLTMEEIRAGVANEWLGIKLDTEQILGTIHTDVLARWIGIEDITAVHWLQIRSKAANELVGLHGDVKRLLDMMLSQVGASFRLMATEAERGAVHMRAVVTNELVGLRNDGAALGTSIGTAIGGGIWYGMSIWAAPIASLAAGMVTAAIAAARIAAQVSSPSKRTMYIGEMMGKGLVLGFEKGASGGSLFGSFGLAGGSGRGTTATFNMYGTQYFGADGSRSDPWSGGTGWAYAGNRV